MKEFEMRNIGSHIEVYTAGGVFLFSADTVREAMEELEEEVDFLKSIVKLHSQQIAELKKAQ